MHTPYNHDNDCLSVTTKQCESQGQYPGSEVPEIEKLPTPPVALYKSQAYFNFILLSPFGASDPGYKGNCSRLDWCDCLGPNALWKPDFMRESLIMTAMYGVRCETILVLRFVSSLLVFVSSLLVFVSSLQIVESPNRFPSP